MPKNSKNNIFLNQQLLIKDKLLELLNITNNKNYFTLYDIDNDLEKQNSILSLATECEKYFATSKWTYFANIKKEKNTLRPALVLAKNILTSMNIDLINTTCTITDNNKKKIATSKYIIV